MTNKFYVPGKERAERVHSLFATIASRYDLINDLQSFGLHRLWKRRLLKLACVKPDDCVLDLCCGTGDLPLALARRGVRTVGLDFSAPMLAVAEQRAKILKSKSFMEHAPQFIRGDATRLPFEDNSFDAVTISYGLRNLADWEQGLREMRRVAKPGGRLLVLDFGKPDHAVLRWFYFAYLKYAVPVLGRVFCGDADTHGYILESLQNYAAQNGVDAKMREMNLVRTRIINLMGGAMSINYAEKPEG